MNVYPARLGVIVYLPFISVKLEVPELFVVVVPLPPPLSVSRVWLPDGAPVTVPEMVHVGTAVPAKLTAVMLAPLIVTV